MKKEAEKRRGRGRPPKLERRTNRFFKIILPSTLEQNMLRIPEKFARKFGSQLSGVAILTVPTGFPWEVAIIKRENKLYFSEGWNEFMDSHCITYGYFLVFEYHGNCHFQVHIYGLSCCEIDYPNPNPSEYHCLKKEEEQIHGNGMLATKSQSPSFTIAVQKYNINPTSSYLYVPSSFAKMYFMGRNSVKLKGEDGRDWDVKYSYSKRGGSRLCGGWNQFRQHYNLVEGDIYTFDLMVDEDDHNNKHNNVPVLKVSKL